jgi:aminoglycoside 3-N-acetyltransferase
VTFRDFVTGFRKLEIDRLNPVIVHASLSAFGELHGGTDSIIGALCSSFETVVMPAFTYKTMITPEMGPPENGMSYGSGRDANRMAEIFQPDMPVDIMMGILPEVVRVHPKAKRSSHPILSFVGINAGKILDTQAIKEPLAPIQALSEAQGWVLLLGVDHKANTSIHYGEQLAGRKQFIRWALTPKGVIPCHKFPGCSTGFNAISPYLDEAIRRIEIGEAVIQAIPVQNLLDSVINLLKDDPLALLCSQPDCARCTAVRESVENPQPFEYFP